jgi:hypothetical protein
MADKDSCAENCKFFDFTTPEPPFGYGSNWWCKFHKKRIKDASKKCVEHKDRYKIKAGVKQ